MDLCLPHLEAIRKQKIVVKVGVIHKMKQSFGKYLHQAYNNKKEHSQNTSNTINFR